MLGALALGASACGGGPATSSTVEAQGVTVTYPTGWYATMQALTPVTSPRQVLAVASYPLPSDSSGADGCQPKEALNRLPPTGAFIFGWEYGGLALPGLRARDFPQRPKRFALTGFAHYECQGPSYMIRFRDGGRLFQIHVAFGPLATALTRHTVLRILDSLGVASR